MKVVNQLPLSGPHVGVTAGTCVTPQQHRGSTEGAQREPGFGRKGITSKNSQRCFSLGLLELCWTRGAVLGLCSTAVLAAEGCWPSCGSGHALRQLLHPSSPADGISSVAHAENVKTKVQLKLLFV